jgi:hypothetical protein
MDRREKDRYQQRYRDVVKAARGEIMAFAAATPATNRNKKRLGQTVINE